MATSFYGGSFFGGEFFNQGGGGARPDDGGRGIVKPTGLLHVPKKNGRTKVDDRVDDSALIQAEIAEKLAREFGEETLRLPPEQPPVVEMSLAEMEFEIGVLLRKKLRTEEDEIMLLLLMVASA